MIDCFINYDCKTSLALIQDALFTTLKLRFVFDPQLRDLQLLTLSFSFLHD